MTIFLLDSHELLLSLLNCFLPTSYLSSSPLPLPNQKKKKKKKPMSPLIVSGNKVTRLDFVFTFFDHNEIYSFSS